MFKLTHCFRFHFPTFIISNRNFLLSFSSLENLIHQWENPSEFLPSVSPKLQNRRYFSLPLFSLNYLFCSVLCSRSNSRYIYSLERFFTAQFWIDVADLVKAAVPTVAFSWSKETWPGWSWNLNLTHLG